MKTRFVGLMARGAVAAVLFLLGSTLSGSAAESLVWDSLQKTYTAKAGETNAYFTFSVTNSAATEAVINSVKTSCGCTAAKLPPLPWKLSAGTNGQVDVTVDLRGKRGTITKTITVDSTDGTKLLMVTVNIPDAAAPSMNGIASPMDRNQNQMAALADRQAVFKNDCASCHVQPTVGKMGEPLYAAACGICHEAEHRASMVTDLKSLQTAASRDYWRVWIARGKVGSLMPGFAKTEGGPLNDAQIDSLVDYLVQKFPARIAAGQPVGNPTR